MAVKDRPKAGRAQQSTEKPRSLRSQFDRLEADARNLEADARNLEATARDLKALAVRQAEGPQGTTVQELAAQARVPEEALVEFARTAGALLGGRPLSTQAARRAATLAAVDQVWEGELGPLLSSAQVGDLLGGVSRQRVNELLRAKRLIGLHGSAGRLQFPAFKFNDGRPLEPLVRAYWTLRDASLGEWSAASWCVSPDTALGGRSPVQWAHDGMDTERLAQVARQDAARLSR